MQDGDVAAALRLVRNLIRPEVYASAQKQFGLDVLYVPIICNRNANGYTDPIEGHHSGSGKETWR